MYIVNKFNILMSYPDNLRLPTGSRKATEAEISHFKATGEQQVGNMPKEGVKPPTATPAPPTVTPATPSTPPPPTTPPATPPPTKPTTMLTTPPPTKPTKPPQ